MADKTRTEEFRVDGDKVVSKIKELVNEGNVRRVILKTEGGRTLLEVPLTLGVGVAGLGIVFAPFLMAVAAVAALVTRLTLVVEREGDRGASPPTKKS